MIKGLRKTGDMAIVLVEQYIDFAFDLADRFEVLQQGRVVLSGARGAIPREKLFASVSV